MSTYLNFWGVTTPVFAPRHGRIELYLPERLTIAAQRMASFCTHDQTLTVLAGESGTGKTAVTRWLHDTLATDSHEFLLTTLLREEHSSGWLAPRIAEYMGVANPGNHSLHEVITSVAGRLDELIAEKRRLIIAVDAAHWIQGAGWQDISGFLNLGALAGSCFSFLLVGRQELISQCSAQTDLRHKLSCKMEWPRFGVEETSGYLRFRCEQAGINNPFDAEAVASIHQITCGVASAINALAENTLIEAYERKAQLVTSDIVRSASRFIPGPQSSQAPQEATESDDLLGARETTKNHLLELTKSWIPPPPESAKPLSPTAGSDATIRMSSLFKSRDKGGDS